MDAEASLGVVCDVIDELLVKAARSRVEITHIVMCSFWHSLMGVDRNGRPTTPVLGWADTRSGEYSAKLKKRFDETEVHDRTGAHFHSSFWPAKLLWIGNELPKAFAATETWMGFGDFVALHLTGHPRTSVSMASATGVFHQRSCDWDDELLRYLKITRKQLPYVSRSQESFPLSQTTIDHWPQLKNTHVLPGVGDGAADHIGSCGIGKDRASLMVGTSAAMRIAYEGQAPRHVPQGLWCYRIDERRVIIGGALSDGGNLYEWCARNLSLPRDANEQLRHRPPGEYDVAVLPFFFGERSTGYREHARGAILGVTAESDGLDILQACMEAVAYRIAAISDRLTQVAKPAIITASGGALQRSAAWPQMIADVLGREITLSRAEESASRGTVLLALESLGKIDNIASLEFPEGPTLAFDPARHASYKKGRARHEAALSKAYGTES